MLKLNREIVGGWCSARWKKLGCVPGDACSIRQRFGLVLFPRGADKKRLLPLRCTCLQKRAGGNVSPARHLESRCTNLYENITVSYRCRVARTCPSLPFSRLIFLPSPSYLYLDTCNELTFVSLGSGGPPPPRFVARIISLEILLAMDTRRGKIDEGNDNYSFVRAIGT